MEVLPDDLVLKCLVRVPYESHENLKAVCRGWETMVSSPQFYTDRKKSGTSEQLICFIQKDLRADGNNSFNLVFAITVYDPVKGTLERLSPIDHPECPGIPIWCQCVAVNRKLVLIGGLHPSSKRAMKSIYIYDFVSAKWSRGADMPTPRYFFACSVSSSTGLIYVAGGSNEDTNPPAAAEAYNVEEDKWEILAPMIQPRSHGCQGVFMKGKFMVMSGREFDRRAQVFDPSAGTWRMWEDMWITSRGELWESCVVGTSSGDLYVFYKQFIMKYDGDQNVWVAVATLPVYFQFVTCATQWRDSLFVSGFDVLTHKHVSYLFNPLTRQSIEVNSGGGGDIVVSAATVEI